MTGFRAGPSNSLADIAGLRVGNAADESMRSGVTVVVPDEPVTAAVQVLGGAPGTRETDLLEAHNSVEKVHALVLSGGSAFGLDAASGVQAALREQGRGFRIGPHIIPIVPAAIVFDLANGQPKDWGRFPPYRDLGYEAACSASIDVATGSVGAGIGALTATVKGGLGTASTVLADGTTVAALVVANPVGSPLVAQTPHFWAAPFEIGAEFGGLGLPSPLPADTDAIRIKFRHLRNTGVENTTIGIIATDAALSKAECKRLAIAAHDGFARAIWPVHTPMDGDLVFGIATGTRPRPASGDDFIDLCAAAAATMTRAIARGVHDATPATGDLYPAWCTLGRG
ncbi:peptidase T4 [Zhengella mangrovi]|uniref:Peptidase T4 n=1 Tax=Zhengella mangrovi TaxID=1982044 RepID=A0A2G1QM90_9HYPH|nr:P1 family peptidase [Zhengella mangrovi]PHP66646.1 peptidase T4 [Zhengella mangrovi]